MAILIYMIIFVGANEAMKTQMKEIDLGSIEVLFARIDLKLLSFHHLLHLVGSSR